MKYDMLVAVVIGVVILYFYLRASHEGLEMNTESAAEACKKISSRAEEIEAHYGGAKGLLQNIPVLSLFNPNNYKSGDNKTDDMGRNIINTDLSTEDITKINNDCSNMMGSVQINEINTENCPYCQTNGCPVTGVRQENTEKASQMCMLQSATEILMKKKNSIDAQALAQTLQKASGIMSGDNTANKQNCNIVNTDMSSKQYLEHLSNCANIMSSEQVNRIKSCGPVSDVIQRNLSEKLQDCIITSTSKAQTDIDVDAAVKAEAKTEQTTTGIDPLSSAASLSSSCIVIIGLIGVAFVMNEMQTETKA